MIQPTDAPDIQIGVPENPQDRRLWELAIRKWRRGGPRDPETSAEWGQVVGQYNTLRRKMAGPLGEIVRRVAGDHG